MMCEMRLCTLELQGPPGENIIVLSPVRAPVMAHFVRHFQFVSTIFVLNVYGFFLCISVLLGIQILLLPNKIVTNSVTPG